MHTITALTAQQRRTDRVNVFLDGAYAFSLATAVALSLRVGDALSAAQIAALQAADQVAKGKELAVAQISRRPRSIAEISRYLKQKGYDSDAVAAIVADLQRVDLLDDAQFAQYWVEQRETFRPRSHMALAQELLQKGVDRSLVQTMLAGVDEEAAAYRAAESKARQLAHLPEETFQQKLGQFLQRRGFPYDIIRHVTNDLWRQLAADADVTP